METVGAGVDPFVWVGDQRCFGVDLIFNPQDSSRRGGQYCNFENVIGSAFARFPLTGDDGALMLSHGGAGNDFLNGPGGDDILNGGEGNDVPVRRFPVKRNVSFSNMVPGRRSDHGLLPVPVRMT